MTSGGCGGSWGWTGRAESATSCDLPCQRSVGDAGARVTEELEVLQTVTRRLEATGIRYMEEDFYLDREAVRAAIANRGVFNLIHQAYVVKVDCIVRKDSEYRQVEFARQRRGSIQGHGLAIVAPEDLIISKLDWMRESRSEVQFADVRNLLSSVPDLDRQYLAHWTER